MLVLVLALGLAAALALMAMLLWSIAFPPRRLWPPMESTPLNRMTVWALTVVIFASTGVLAVLDWNASGWPAALRWGLGGTLIVLGNVLAWRGACRMGMQATSGAEGKLITDGMYRFSRNPQYVADMGIFVGATILSASPAVLMVAAAGIAVLLVAPLAEEPWLAARHGEAWARYSRRTRRYF
ncbi:methyltransferase family protein [Piscinibacter sakaiensis]|uniref:methyltransferase family protein n=1 Tax=Piscinibacter sakaiensis TaxID=1547922 RepID=UPI003AADE976